MLPGVFDFSIRNWLLLQKYINSRKCQFHQLEIICEITIIHVGDINNAKYVIENSTPVNHIARQVKLLRVGELQS